MSHAGKISQLGKYVLRPGLLNDEARKSASLIPRDWPGKFDAFWQALLDKGETKCSEVLQDGRRVMLLLYSVDDRDGAAPPEFVIVGAFSTETRADMTAEVLPLVEQKARDLGCGTIRFHTMRAGLVAKTLLTGWRVSEIIVRKTL